MQAMPDRSRSRGLTAVPHPVGRARLKLAGLGLSLALLGLVPPAEAQEAHKLHLDTDFGPLTLRVNFNDRSVDGFYPKFEGKVTGQLTKDGNGIHGTWVQAKSDHLCDEEKFGTRAWGHFYFLFTNQADKSTTMAGQFGYCDEEPSQPWNGVVD